MLGALFAILLAASGTMPLDPGWAAVLGLLAGFALFPPGRHRYAAQYPGAPWGVPGAMFLVSLLFVFQFIILSTWSFFLGNRIYHSTIHLLTLSGLGSLAAASVIALNLEVRGLSLASLGLTRATVLPGAVHGVRLGLVLVTLNVLFVKFSSSADIWSLAGMEVTAMLYNAEDLATGLVCLLLATIVAPLAEEILFRGVLFTALRRSRGPFWATIWSALLFGMVHGATAIMVTFFGIGFAVAYHLTGTLWTSIFAHAVLNGITALIAWNHGHVTTRITWGELGMVLAGLALILPFSGWILARSSVAPGPGPCPTCGEEGRVEGRCAGCATPQQAMGKWTRRLLEAGASGYLFLAGMLALGIHGLTRMGYHPAVPGTVLLVQAGLQSGTDSEKGFELAKRWVAERPGDAMGRLALSGFLYQRGDFLAILDVVAPVLQSGLPVDQAFQLQNVISLALAELGRGEIAVELGQAALDSAPPEHRPALEDTLGWALANSGRLSEASAHIEQAISSMSFLRRSDVAELSYHRGLVRLARGEEAHGRELLGEAARTGEAGFWFARRATRILTAGKLPTDLLPVELSSEASRIRISHRTFTEGPRDVPSVTDAGQLRRRLAREPANAEARLRLLGILLGIGKKGASAALAPPGAEIEILEHLVWFITHSPDHPALPCLPAGKLPTSDSFRRPLLGAWKDRLERKPSSADPLRAAARMTGASDPDFAIACLKRAFLLRPGAVVREELARAQLRVIPITPVLQRPARARQTLEWLEATDPDRGRPREEVPQAPVWSTGLTELSRRAVVALEARDQAKAELYANALLDMSILFMPGQSGPRGIANHLGNIVLGHLCLRRGDRDNARRHLQVSGFIASPGVSSWRGPDLSLARRIARRGQTSAAGDYLSTWMKVQPVPPGLPTLADLVRSSEDEARGLLHWVLEELVAPGHASPGDGGAG